MLAEKDTLFWFPLSANIQKVAMQATMHRFNIVFGNVSNHFYSLMKELTLHHSACEKPDGDAIFHRLLPELLIPLK